MTIFTPNQVIHNNPSCSAPAPHCWTCLTPKVVRSKHCSVCDRCVHVMDHHCPWVGNCVARDNHRTFVTFLMLMVFMQVQSLQQCNTIKYHHNFNIK